MQDLDTIPAALRCVNDGVPVLISLTESRMAFNSPELKLGATHVLAIPIVESLTDCRFIGQPVSIAVDLRLGALSRLRLRMNKDPEKLTIVRRAENLSRELRGVEQFRSQAFVPLRSTWVIEVLRGATTLDETAKILDALGQPRELPPTSS